MVMNRGSVTPSPKDVLWLTNIPTPYRHARFRLLDDALSSRGRSLFVAYMAERHSNRFWSYDSEEAQYPHRVIPGFSLRVRTTTFHLNPGIHSLLRAQPRLLVVGGVHNPTAWIAMGTRRSATRTVLMVESNLTSEKRTHGLAALIKTWMVRRSDGYLIPGQASLPYLSSKDGVIEQRPVLVLPNIINEAHFPERGSDAAMSARRDLRREWGISDYERVVVIPARMEVAKGIPDLVSALHSVEAPLDCTFVFAGDGSLRRSVEALAPRHKIRVLGQVPSARMGQVYAAADVMLLPSRSDPSPLSVVEAIRCGLPIAISGAVGNSHEALVANENGWSFAPADPQGLKDVLLEICTLDKAILDRMGYFSAQIHERWFQSYEAVNRLASSLDELLAQGEWAVR